MVYAFDAFERINENIKDPTGRARECNMLARQIKSDDLRNLIKMESLPMNLSVG